MAAGDDTSLVVSLVGYTPPDLPVATVPDITGTVGAPATFDGSGTTGPADTILAWTWTSIPVGSTVAIATTLPFPYPDSQAATPIDMTDNEALYHLDGTGDDTSGNALNLTQYNSPTFPVGKVGSNCIEFDGVDQYAQATVPTGTAGTIACWLQLTGTPSNSEVFIGLGVNASSTNGTWRAIAWYTGGLSFFGRGGSSQDIYGWGGSLAVGRWYHVVITWDASNLVSCYLDGVLITAQSKSLLSPASDLSLGARLNAGTYYADCKLDEVAVWSRTLSASEIEDIYELQAPLYTPTPLPDSGVSNTFDLSMADNEGLYHFEAASHAHDSSGFNRDGTITGAVQVSPGKVGAKAYQFAHADSTDIITFGTTGFDFVSADAFSFSLWVKPDSSQPGTNAVLFSKSNFSTTGYALFQNGGANSNSYSFVVGTGSGLAGTGVNFSLRADQWNHVCLTRSANGAQTRIYVNNILVTDVSNLTTIASSDPVTLGIGNFSAAPGAALAFNGTLDEFAIWSRELTPLEVETVYDYGNGTYAGWGETFTFTPDVAGTYTVEAEATSLWGSDSDTANAVISAPATSGAEYTLLGTPQALAGAPSSLKGRSKLG